MQRPVIAEGAERQEGEGGSRPAIMYLLLFAYILPAS